MSQSWIEQARSVNCVVELAVEILELREIMVASIIYVIQSWDNGTMIFNGFGLVKGGYNNKQRESLSSMYKELWDIVVLYNRDRDYYIKTYAFNPSYEKAWYTKLLRY